MKSASQSLNTNHQIRTLLLWQKLKNSVLKMLKKHLIQMISLFVMKRFFISMQQFTKNLTKDLKATRLSLTRLCILFRSMLFVLGSRMSISVLTAEELTISVRLMLRLIFLQEHTAQVCLQEDRHRFFLLQRLVR